MKRLRDMDVADSVKACVVAGPGDLMVWEVSACIDSDGMNVEVIGRASDLEAAAAAAIAVLTQNGSVLAASVSASAVPSEGSATHESPA
jgi:hypothetical protein